MNKINQYTRLLTVPLALLQGIGVAVFMQKQGVLNAFGPNDLATTLSILASLAILSALGETINIMTLGGFALSVGILVDDATVTIENVRRHLAMGKEVRIVNSDAAPGPLRAFPGVGEIEIAARVDGAFDAAIIMECGDLTRTGVAGLDQFFVINIDVFKDHLPVERLSRLNSMLLY